MNNLFGQFNGIMQQISQLPFLEQENVCANMQFVFDDYVKRFPPYAIKVYKDVFGTLFRETGFTAENKTILEIGPGFSIGVLFLAAISGASKVNAADAFAHDKGADSDYILSMYTHLLNDRSFIFTNMSKMNENEFTELFTKYITKDESGKFGYNTNKVSFDFPYMVDKLPYDNNTYDCNYSFATFEHFRDPDAAAKELYRITKPGGISYHSVDLRDHRNFDTPLDFLTLNKDTWQQYGKGIKNYSYTNRLRSSEIIECFTNQGFKFCKHIPFLQTSVSDDFRSGLHQDYQKFSSDELGILGCIYIFQK
jgi:SAM-dependent methyltransferase